MSGQISFKNKMNKHFAYAAFCAVLGAGSLILPTSFGGVGTWFDGHQSPGYVGGALKKQFNTLPDKERKVAVDELMEKFKIFELDQPSEFELRSGLVVDLQEFEKNLNIVQTEETEYFAAEGKGLAVLYAFFTLYELGLGVNANRKNKANPQGPKIK